MILYIKLKRNERNNYYNIVVTRHKSPLTIIETLGSIKIKKLQQTKFIKLNINRLKFWLVNNIYISSEITKILIDLNLLPHPILKNKEI